MSRTNLKRYLMLLAVIGLVAIASGGGSGTFASFSAEVANNGNYFASGTLILNDKGGTTTCTSAGDSGNLNIGANNGCDTLFTLPTLAQPHASLTGGALSTGSATTTLNFSAGLLSAAIDAGDSLTITSGANTDTFTAAAGADIGATSIAVTSHTANFAYPNGSIISDSASTYYAKLTLTNAGTLNSSGITFGSSTCGNAAQEGNSTLTVALTASVAPASLTFASLTGSFSIGDPIVVNEGVHTQTFIASSAAAAGSTTVNVQSQPANFSYTTAATVSGPTFAVVGNLCTALKLSIVETDSTFNHSIATPAQGCAYPGATVNTYGLGCVIGSGTALASVPAGPTPLALLADYNGNTGGQLSAGQNRYFLLAVKKPAAAFNNTYQNRKASFDLTWTLDQA